MKRAIHCTTQEQWNHVLEVFEKKGWRWADNTIPLAHIQNWEVYKTKSGINYCDGFCYCEVNYLKSRNYQILSYEEFLEEEGLWKLPEKWCIRGNKDVCEYFQANNPQKYDYIPSMNWFHSDNTKCGLKYISSESKDGSHTEITFDQFKKYILNQKTETMEKEIIGYKLKEECKQYLEAAEIIADAKVDFKKGFSLEYYLKKEKWGNFKENLEKAGVLNLWFEPVYADEFKVGDWVTVSKNFPKEASVIALEVGKTYKLNIPNGKSSLHVEGKGENIPLIGICDITDCFRKATPEEIKNASTPNITVNEYKGEFFDWGVKFGCAEIQKEIFISLSKHIGHTYVHTNREVESVTIGKGTFTKDQIREIAEYYLNK